MDRSSAQTTSLSKFLASINLLTYPSSPPSPSPSLSLTNTYLHTSCMHLIAGIETRRLHPHPMHFQSIQSLLRYFFKTKNAEEAFWTFVCLHVDWCLRRRAWICVRALECGNEWLDDCRVVYHPENAVFHWLALFFYFFGATTKVAFHS